jgi:hypothetical protein
MKLKCRQSEEMEVLTIMIQKKKQNKTMISFMKTRQVKTIMAQTLKMPNGT